MIKRIVARAGRYACVGLAAVCLTDCRAPEKYPTTAAAHREHAVGHAPGTCDLCDLYYDAQDYVVRILGQGSEGAGVIVSSTGGILTSAHVVRGNDRPIIELRNGDLFRARVVRADRRQDLALLQIDGAPTTWIPARVTRAGLPPVGSDVYVVGHPLGLGWTVSRGIVSAIRRPGEVASSAMIQTDAAVSPGNSGGPLLNADGDLLGVVAAKVIARGAENVAFAVPASAVMQFLEQPAPSTQPSISPP